MSQATPAPPVPSPPAPSATGPVPSSAPTEAGAGEYVQERQLVDANYQIEEPPKRPWSNLPGPQFRLLLGLGLLAGLVLFMFLSGMSGQQSQKKKETETTAQVAETASINNPDQAQIAVESALSATDGDTETVNLDGTPRSEDATPTPSPSPVTNTAAVRHRRPVARRPIAPRPRRRHRVGVPPVARVVPRQRVIAPSPSPSPVPQVSPSPEPIPVDPHQRYQEMLEFASLSNRDAYVPPATVALEEPASDPEPVLVASEDIAAIGAPGPAPAISAVVADGDAITVGETFKAKLITPAVWTQDVPLDDARVFAQLSESLGSIPEDSILVLRVKQASQGGFLSLVPESVSVNGESRPLPESLLIRGKGGRPIRAKVKGTGRGIQLSDVAGIALAGANQAANFINRSNTNTTFSSGFSQTVTDRQGNVLAAVGQGVTNRVLEMARARTERIREVNQPYFQVSEGYKVEIFVTENIQL